MYDEVARLFPLEYLGGDDSARSMAFRWVYRSHAWMAYAEFLKRGRGFLIGPFATDENGKLLAGSEVTRRRAAGEAIGLTAILFT